MAFTNVYDVTFPPDTQLANLLGQDLRNFRVDTQQRMAAISGLDAAKPSFATDAQPANWNGILFFATDTGQIYQFNNPSWTNVTADFVPTTVNRIILQNLSNATITASNSVFFGLGNGGNFVFGSSPNIMPGAAVFKNLYVLTSTSQSGTGSLVFTVLKNGVATALQVTIPFGSANGTYSDTVDSASFAAGDKFSIQITNNATVTSASIASIGLTY